MASRLGFLDGGGELGRLIAGFDWSGTSLGPIADWPAAVRNAVALALRTPLPTALLFGHDGVMLYNDGYIEIAGQRHPGALGAPVREAWPEATEFNDHVVRTVMAGGVLSYRDQEFTLRRRGVDEQVWLNLDYSPIPGEDGTPIGVVAFLSETTGGGPARARAGGRARSGSSSMFEQAPSFIAMVRGPEHVFDLANAAFRQLVGHRPIVGKSGPRGAARDRGGRGSASSSTGSMRPASPSSARRLRASLQRSPGAAAEQRFVDFVYQPVRDADGQVAGIFVEGIDITDRLEAERAYRASEARFRTFSESMPNHVWSAALDGSLDWFNLRVYEYSGARPGELDGDGWARLVHPDDLPAASARWAQALATGEPYEAEFRLRRADGVFRHHIARAVLIRDGDGRPTGWIGTNTDIDNQIRTERALRDSELRLRLSQQAGGIASLEVDVATGEVFGDDGLWALWGLPPAESVPIGVLENLVVPEHAAIRSNEATRAAGTAAPKVEYQIRRADTGALRWISRDIEFRYDAEGRPTKMFGVMRDVTEAKEAEARQRILTHELEHRIKNILATVAAIASQTLRDTDIDTARTSLNQRLQALAAGHDILNRARWTQASLASVVAAAIEPFGAGPDQRRGSGLRRRSAAGAVAGAGGERARDQFAEARVAVVRWRSGRDHLVELDRG